MFAGLKMVLGAPPPTTPHIKWSHRVSLQVLAASDAEMDMADWARPFEFGACLWSMPRGEHGDHRDFCDQVRGAHGAHCGRSCARV